MAVQRHPKVSQTARQGDWNKLDKLCEFLAKRRSDIGKNRAIVGRNQPRVKLPDLLSGLKATDLTNVWTSAINDVHKLGEKKGKAGSPEEENRLLFLEPKSKQTGSDAQRSNKGASTRWKGAEIEEHYDLQKVYQTNGKKGKDGSDDDLLQDLTLLGGMKDNHQGIGSVQQLLQILNIVPLVQKLMVSANNDGSGGGQGGKNQGKRETLLPFLSVARALNSS